MGHNDSKKVFAKTWGMGQYDSKAEKVKMTRMNWCQRLGRKYKNDLSE